MAALLVCLLVCKIIQKVWIWMKFVGNGVNGRENRLLDFGCHCLDTLRSRFLKDYFISLHS